MLPLCAVLHTGPSRLINSVISDECVQDFDLQKGFTVHTVKSYEPGEQLFINYGNHGNLRLLRNYGFTVPNNPYDVVNLPMPASLQKPRETDPAFSQKHELLSSVTESQAGIPALNVLRFQNDGSLAQNAEHWLEVMLATPDELNEVFKLAASQASPETGSTTTSLRLPSSLAQKVRSEVHKVVASRLEQYTSTFEVSRRIIADKVVLATTNVLRPDRSF
ncbi:unnamed protein product [Phytophthora fragariaefolia]|uniref:Unnamed protein product n=1 Tax=Phytophthora fragariaefolia TaxID=1490495 RepID=A0A9W6XSW8_9STRA|nr:unnamed protein product [Phytophthora fragariaefolia]